jgi:Carboxypeptidase regulatory-like domain
LRTGQARRAETIVLVGPPRFDVVPALPLTDILHCLESAGCRNPKSALPHPVKGPKMRSVTAQPSLTRSAILVHLIRPAFLAILFALLPGQLLMAAPVTNADVAKLLSAGMGDDVILNVIAGGEPKFDISPDGLIALKEKGASQAVLAAIAKRQGEGSKPSAPAPGVTAAPGIAALTGKVLDGFGKPLAGATVSVANTTFSSSTGIDGGYSVAYVPGGIRVIYSKEGYYQANLDLQISVSSNYPVQDVTLWLVPPGKGFYWINQGAYVPVAGARLNSHHSSTESRDRWGVELLTTLNTWSALGQPTVISAGSNGEVAFLDNDGLYNHCLRMTPTGVFLQGKEVGLGSENKFDYAIMPEQFRDIAPGVCLRSSRLEPGPYVFVTSEFSRFDEYPPMDITGKLRFGEPLYMFSVGAAVHLAENRPVDSGGPAQPPPAQARISNGMVADLVARPLGKPVHPDKSFSDPDLGVTVSYPADFEVKPGKPPLIAFFLPPGPSVSAESQTRIWALYPKIPVSRLSITTESEVLKAIHNIPAQFGQSEYAGPVPSKLGEVDAQTFVATGVSKGVTVRAAFTIAVVNKHILSVAMIATPEEFTRNWDEYLRLCRSCLLQ